jgi:hypothetical protein
MNPIDFLDRHPTFAVVILTAMVTLLAVGCVDLLVEWLNAPVALPATCARP